MKQFFAVLITLLFYACSNNTGNSNDTGDKKDSSLSYIEKNLAGYATVKLTTDISKLSEKEKQMLPLFIEAAKIMDGLYWQQCFGNKDSLLNTISDEKTKQFLTLNYGPWDKLNNDTPFLAGVRTKPPGAQFYPDNITKEELEKATVPDKHGLYSLIRRDSTGKLISIPYHIAYKGALEKASSLLKQAAALAEDPSLKKYLEL